LSPILYSIYVNDTPLPANNRIKLGLFADDTAYWTSAKTVRRASSNLQKAANKFTQWCRRWKLILNEKKTQFVIFYPGGRGTKKDKEEISIIINKVKIKPNNSAIYLDCTLDQRLNFKKHIAIRRKKGLQVFALLKSILLADLPMKIKIRIYLAILRPMMVYGHELFHSGINIDLIYKYERYWLRTSRRMWKHEAQDLYKDVPIKHMDEYLQERKIKYITSSINKKFAQQNLQLDMNIKILRHHITLQELILHTK